MLQLTMPLCICFVRSSKKVTTWSATDNPDKSRRKNQFTDLKHISMGGGGGVYTLYFNYHIYKYKIISMLSHNVDPKKNAQSIIKRCVRIISRAVSSPLDRSKLYTSSTRA